MWISSDNQLEKHAELRPPKLRERDIERARKEGQIATIEQIMGAPKIIVAPSFYYLAIFW